MTLVALFFFLTLLGLESRALAWPVTMTWDPNPPTDMVTGYTIHYGTVSRSDPMFTAYTGQVDAGNVNTYSIDLPAGSSTYYISATAYNQSGTRSDYSNEIVATYTPPSWSITASAGSNGSITPNGALSVISGAGQTFTITPATGYHVANVTVDGTSVGAVASYTFSNVTANHTIAATFAIDTFTVTASAGANGSISPNGTVNGQPRRQPDLHHHAGKRLPRGERHGGRNLRRRSGLVHLLECDGQPYDRRDLRHRHLHRDGELRRLKRLHQPERDGDGQPRRRPGPSPSRRQSGYHVANVTVDGTSVGAVTSYTFSNVTANHTIAATFAIDTFTVTASAGSNGSHQPERDGDGQPRRQPDLHHHAGDRPLRGERDGRRNLRRRGGLVHVLKCDGQPHHHCKFYTCGASGIPHHSRGAIEGPCGKGRLTATVALLWNDLRSILGSDVTRTIDRSVRRCRAIDALCKGSWSARCPIFDEARRTRRHAFSPY